jgi:hypothetical protein
MTSHIMQRRQRGISLIEVMGALAVGTLLFMGLSDMVNISLEDTRGQQAAQYQAQVVVATRNYLATNYSTVLGNVATAPSGTLAVTVKTLRDENFLPVSFGDTNNYQQNTCVLVRRASAVTKELDVLVATYGGDKIPDRIIASVAVNAGQGAGYIPESDWQGLGGVGVARGPSWKLDTTDFRTGKCAGANVLTGTAADGGHLVSNLFHDDPSRTATNFLYRDDMGDPALNQMNTPLLMAGAALRTNGDACTQAGLAIESSTGNLLLCRGGTWKYSESSWKAPVANYGSLPLASASDPGDVVVTQNDGRAYAFTTASGWIPISIDRNGDMVVPRNFSTQTGHITSAGNITATGNIDARDITANQTLSVANGGSFVSNGPITANKAVMIGASGSLIVNGPMTANNTFTANSTFTANGNISANRNLTVTQTLTANGDLNANRNLTVAQILTANGDLNAKRNLTVEQTLIANGYIDAKGNLGVAGNINGGGALDMAGSIHSASDINADKWSRGGLMATQAIILDGRQSPGNACNYMVGSTLFNPLGTVAPDSNGILLSCQADGIFRYSNGQLTP